MINLIKYLNNVIDNSDNIQMIIQYVVKDLKPRTYIKDMKLPIESYKRPWLNIMRSSERGLLIGCCVLCKCASEYLSD